MLWERIPGIKSSNIENIIDLSVNNFTMTECSITITIKLSKCVFKELQIFQKIIKWGLSAQLLLLSQLFWDIWYDGPRPSLEHNLVPDDSSHNIVRILNCTWTVVSFHDGLLWWVRIGMFNITHFRWPFNNCQRFLELNDFAMENMMAHD